MTWSLIGGDPAPGDTSAILLAATALRTVANLTDDIADAMQNDHSTLTSGVWSGRSYQAYLADADKVLPQIKEARKSYTDAASALDTYRAVIETEQAYARAALAKAATAESDRAGAETRRAAAQDSANALYSNYQQAARDVANLQRQLAATADPGVRAVLTNQLARVQAYGRQTWANHVDSGNEAARFASASDEAERRLAEARADADRIRHAVDTAADRLVQALKAAEHEANLPGLLDRTWTVTKETVQEYGPAIVSVLKLVSTAVTLLSFAFPPLASVALVLGIAVLAGDLLLDMTNDNGFTLSEGLGLAVDVLGVVAVAGRASAVTSKLLGGAVRAKQIETFGEAAGTWINVGSAGLSTAQGVVDHDPYQIGFSVGGFLLGPTAGRLARGALAKVDGNPVVHKELESINRSIAKEPPTVIRRYAQSVLSSPRYGDHGGQVLPGGNDPAERYSHAMSGDQMREFNDVSSTSADTYEKGRDAYHELYGKADPTKEHY